jgi:DNA-binding GntR family transcriptional regulator
MNRTLESAERLLAASGLARASLALTSSLPEQIASRLSERIVSGAYAPGQRIMEQALAAEFAVSRGPIRESLRMLERDGLVTILPRRGAIVTDLSIEEVKEIFDIRAMLNGLRDRLVAEDPQRSKVLAAVESEVAKLTRCAKDPKKGQQYVETVWAINRILTEACTNTRLKNILDSLSRQTLRYSQLGLSTPERRKQSVQHWEGLVAALRKGDGAAAERIARERVTDSRDGAIRALQSVDSPKKRQKL